MKKSKPQNTINLQNGTLVLSLMEAKKPVVWNISLTEAEMLSWSIGQTDKGEHTLLYKKIESGNKSEDVELAVFEEEHVVVRLLSDINDQIRQNTTKVAVKTKKQETEGKSNWVAAIIALLVLGGLILILMNLSPSRAPLESGGVSQPGSVSPALQQQMNTGVGQPLSADEFLKAR